MPQLIKNNIFLNVIVYNTKPVSFYQELEIASDKTKEKTQALFQKNSPTMGTNIYDAVVAAMQMKNVDTVVLICDGPPGSGKYVTYNDIIQNITAQNNKNIIIHTISLFALGSTKKFLQQLAQKNNGTFYSH